MNKLPKKSKEKSSVNEYMKKIGSFIRYNRILQNKCQEDVYLEAGISKSTLSLLERGYNTSMQTIIKILKVLNVSDVLDSFHISDSVPKPKLKRKPATINPNKTKKPRQGRKKASK
ncbi:MAG: helix-turn-helix domain-containing protein [Chitinophagales bacterium]|nr:helix-turn-helix domain-containing protein [Chitinophagales bacterium]